MATATVTIYFDTGSSVSITEQSVIPISDNVGGAALAQAAFAKTLSALGLTITAPEQGTDEKGTDDGGSGGRAGGRTGRNGADVPAGKAGDPGR